MKFSARTQGATLILTVMIVMVTMAVILVVTSQLALSSRSSTAAQDATVRATYAAESGIARAQAQLNVTSALLSTGSIKIPENTTTSALKTDITTLCGGTTLAIVANSGVLCRATDATKNLLSGLTTAQLKTSNRLDFLTKYVPLAAFTSAGYPVSDATAAKEFWAQSFGDGFTLKGKNNRTYSTQVRLILSAVRQIGIDNYALDILVPDVSATGTPQESSSRTVRVSSRNVTPYTLNIGRTSFSKYALFTNHHFSSPDAEVDDKRIYFTSNTLFSGPVHTNGQFTFTEKPYFGGPVTSAGCPRNKIATNTTTKEDYCSAAAQPGAYMENRFSTSLVTRSNMSPNDQAPKAGRSCDRWGRCTYVTQPQFLNGVDWKRNFVPLPTNANDQAGRALQGGISVTGAAIDRMTLKATTARLNGSSASTDVQSISYTIGSATTNLVVDASNRVYMQDATRKWVIATQNSSTGVWTPGGAGTTFNGVIYSQGGVKNLSGPARTSADDPDTAPAAIARFSQITLATAGDVGITSDLKYAEPPCTGQNTVSSTGVFTPATCDNKDAKNIFGIFSSEGDVKIISPNSANKPCTTSTADIPCATRKDVTIQAVLMASGQPRIDGTGGRVFVDGYDRGNADNSLGKIHLLGGVIENYYGAFGTTAGTGYGRDFVYDPRTSEGLTPPSFPTERSWTAGLDRRLTLDKNGYQIQKGQ